MSEARGHKLNWRQACARMGCGKTKFYELVNSGKLPAFRSGERGLFVYETDVNSLVAPVPTDSGEEISQVSVR